MIEKLFVLCAALLAPATASAQAQEPATSTHRLYGGLITVEDVQGKGFGLFEHVFDTGSKATVTTAGLPTAMVTARAESAPFAPSGTIAFGSVTYYLQLSTNDVAAKNAIDALLAAAKPILTASGMYALETQFNTYAEVEAYSGSNQFTAACGNNSYLCTSGSPWSINIEAAALNCSAVACTPGFAFNYGGRITLVAEATSYNAGTNPIVGQAMIDPAHSWVLELDLYSSELNLFLSPGVGNLSASVPEPASWAMMLGGFLLVGGALRRRRSLAIA